MIVCDYSHTMRFVFTVLYHGEANSKRGLSADKFYHDGDMIFRGKHNDEEIVGIRPRW